jgi:hypothetical protein
MRATYKVFYVTFISQKNIAKGCLIYRYLNIFVTIYISVDEIK